MVQMSLEQWTPPQAAPTACEQTKQLVRVESRLAVAIVAWCEANRGREFRLAEVTDAVASSVACAPDSVRRVMASLRKAGHVSVELVSRSASLYRVNA